MDTHSIAVGLIVSYYNETSDSLLLKSPEEITTYVYENIVEKSEHELYSIIQELLQIKGNNAIRAGDFLPSSLQ